MVHGGALLGNADLFGAHGNGHFHAHAAADPVAHLHLADAGGHGAAVGLVHRQLAVQQVDVADEVGHKPAGRVFVNFLGRAHLQHPALAHHGNAAGHGHGLFLVVGHHHHGHAHFFDDVDQLELRLLAQLFVQRAQGLVQQQQLGPLGQAAGQGHALLLPARELVRLAFGKRAQLHQIEHFAGAFLNFVFGQTLALQAKGHVLPDVQVRKQRIALEHHVDGALVGRQPAHILPAQQNLARSGRFKPGQHAQQGGLAAARAAQQRKNFALADGQAHLVHRHRFIKPLDEFLRFQIPLAGHFVCGFVGHGGESLSVRGEWGCK